jgi:2-amino-4-hydroxy-6-hydroxymethyldihydropteridine diphosphokinase
VIECYVGLGSNLGDRMGALASALELLGREEAFAVRGCSRVYETEPVLGAWDARGWPASGVPTPRPAALAPPPQPRYLNAVVRLASLVSPRATYQRLAAIEDRLGRIRRERWGAREIDLDLLLYGAVLSDGPLQLPHPRLHERAFVLAPLCELAPDLRHPRLGCTLREALAGLTAEDRRGVRPLGLLRRRAQLAAEPESPDAAEPPPEAQRAR